MAPSVAQLIPVLATAVMAVATVLTLAWGMWTYKRNGEAQLQMLAFGMLQHYLDLAVAHPDLASRDDRQPVDARYAWFAAQALATAQTLWLVVGRHASWQRSINAIIRQHRPYLQSGALVCGDFGADFLAYLRERVPDLKCAEPCDADRQAPLRRAPGVEDRR